MKALVGASLADNGDTHTNNFIIDFIATYLQSVDLLEVWNIEEPIKVLQQILNNNHLNEPEARLLRETGMNTLIPCFLVGHYVDKQLLGSSAGNTIEQATEMSAYESLRRIFGLTSAQTIFKYGKDAYDLNYQAFAQTNASLQDWTIGEKGLQTQKNVAQ